MSYVQMFQAHACYSWTRPRVKTQFDNLYWSRGLAGDRFVPMADVITSGDKTPSDSLTLSFPTGFNPCNLPTASIIRARAVSVRPLLSAGQLYHRKSQRSSPWGRCRALCLSLPCHTDGYFHSDNLNWRSSDKDIQTEFFMSWFHKF